MGKKKTILPLSVLLVIVAVGVGLYAWHSREPVYEGVRVSVWLEEMNFGQFVPSATAQGQSRIKRRELAMEAMRELGPSALPYVVDRLRADQSGWQSKYRKWFPSWPEWARKILPQPRTEFTGRDATVALMLMGGNVKSQLIELLRDESASVRSAAAFALANLHISQGAEMKAAFDALTPLLKDPDIEVRMGAVGALGAMGPDAAGGVPLLIPLLSASEKGAIPNRTYFLRSVTARTLGQIGPKAESALPALRVLLKDPTPYNRVVAAVAVLKISGDVTNTLPVLIKGLKGPDDASLGEVVAGLEKMGPQAKAAVPVLIERLTEGNGRASSYSLQMISNALVKIDPEEAAKVFKKEN